MIDLPEPLTPADCNLRGLPFMPLHTDRLLDSDMMALSTGEEFKTALRLWCKSWNQEPAASLPDDDRILAHLAGKELAAWRKVKAMALRGWIKCSDGRLYHPVIAEEAIKAMAKRELHQEKKEGDGDRKREEREDRKLLFGALRDIGVILPAKGTSTSHLRRVAASHGIQIVVTEGHKVVTVTPKGSHNESHGGVTAKTGTGTGTDIKEEAAAASPTPTRTHAHEAGDDSPPPPPPEPSNPTSLDAPAGYAVLIRRWEKARGKASTVTSSNPRLAVWAEKRVNEAQLREAYELAVADRELAQDPGPINAGFLDVFLAKVLRPQGGDSALSRQSSAGPAKHWAASWSGIVAKGEELGIVHGSGELAPTFKARVFAAAQLSEEEKAMLRVDYGVSV